MISIEVTTRGIPARIAKMHRVRAALLDAMIQGTDEGIGIAVDAIKSFTPVMVENRGGSHRYPGELRDSIQGGIDVADEGRVSGKVFTNVPWAPFVEWGTREHGRARHMFGLGMREARPLIKVNYEALIRAAQRA